MAVAIASGAMRFVRPNPDQAELLALVFGAGVGLTADESVSVFDFRDRYWEAKHVQLLEGAVSLGATVAFGVRFIALARGSGPATQPFERAKATAQRRDG